MIEVEVENLFGRHFDFYRNFMMTFDWFKKHYPRSLEADDVIDLGYSLRRGGDTTQTMG